MGMIQRSTHRLIAQAAACVALLLAAWPAFGQGRFELTSKEVEPRQERGLDAGDMWIGRLESKPADLKGAPQALSAKASWFSAFAGGQSVFMAVEPDPLTLYVDTDLDGDLSDERPITARPGNEFGTISVAGSGKEAPSAEFGAWAYTANGLVHFVILTPTRVYSGDVTLGGETFSVALVDGTFNGRVDDPFVPGQPHDTIGIDRNGDGRYESWSEVMPLPTVTNSGGVFLRVGVEPDGSAITFEPVTPATGTLKAGTSGVMMTVLSEAGVFRLQSGTDTWPLPVGRYQVTSLELRQDDADGHEWRAGCIELNENEWFVIRKGETTRLGIGPPLTVSTKLQQTGREISMVVTVQGQGGERYFPYPRTEGAAWKPAAFRIVDGAGKELASGKYEYG